MKEQRREKPQNRARKREKFQQTFVDFLKEVDPNMPSPVATEFAGRLVKFTEIWAENSPGNWQIIDQERQALLSWIAEVAPHELPGDRGISPSGIPYTVREDGSRSFAGYGGAFD